MASSSPKVVTLKLLIDTKREKVLFAEASKVVIDFLFSLLSLPLGTVTMLMDKDEIGSMVNLYRSVENLSDTYLQPNTRKDILLKPKVPIPSSSEISGLLPANYGVDSSKTKLYMCYRGCNSNVASVYQSRCPTCGYSTSMTREVNYIGNQVLGDSSELAEGGFVKEVVTYMVTDDLVIQPMSTISSIALLNKFMNKFNVEEVGVLQEKEVQLGITQAVDLLKASLRSKSVLTSVFLKKNVGNLL